MARIAAWVGALAIALGAGSTDVRAAARYAKLDALPDWSGIWFVERGAPDRVSPALKGSYLEAYEAWRQEVQRNHGMVKTSGSNCLPRGMPSIMTLGQYPLEFLFTPGRVTVNQEAWMQVRRIWTDGRPHPEDPEPSFMGDSVGRWEGETLVVDTTAIKTIATLSPGVGHSEKLHVTERLRLNPKDRDQLINSITVEDPEALARPYEMTVTYRRDRTGRLLEFQCGENDRNPVDANGETTFQ